MKNLLIAFYILVPSLAFSAGSGHGSPIDLIFPFVNLSILFGFLAWKLSPVFRNHFSSKHDMVKQTAERAKTLKFEAQLKLEQQEKKNALLDKEIEDIKTNARKEISDYKEAKEKETESKIAKLKTDAENKIEMQKQEYITSLNRELVNLIVNKAKSSVQSEAGLKDSISSKLLKGLN